MSDVERVTTVAGIATLKRSGRRTLAISVLPDGNLELVAPMNASLASILERVAKRAAWINTQRRAFRAMNEVRPVLRYVNGATHRYLGRQYRLKLINDASQSVTLRGAYLHVSVSSGGEEEVKAALARWYRRQAHAQFERRLGRWVEWCRHRKLPHPNLRLRMMPRRWGSTQQDGTICLNPELIRAPSVCVDYVIVHEICHLKYPDHGPKFRGLLQQLCPEWKVIKARLENGDFA